MAACVQTEPCHTGDCSGIDAVRQLLPPGRLWDLGRPSEVSSWFQAVGQVQTEVNKCICQEWNELDPCKAIRLFPYWAKLYCLPDCVEQTPEKLCEWIALQESAQCPIGSIGYYKAVIEFVAPGKGIELDVKQPGLLAGKCLLDAACAKEAVIQITAPPECYFYEEIPDPECAGYIQDGVNPCRCYFIPEIECLRWYVFPLVSIGYMTNPADPDGADIFGVPEENIAVKPAVFYDPKFPC